MAIMRHYPALLTTLVADISPCDVVVEIKAYFTDDAEVTAGSDQLSEPDLHCQIKWDGCSHFWFGQDHYPGYLHLCGRHDVVRLGHVVRQMRTLAEELLPGIVEHDGTVWELPR